MRKHIKILFNLILKLSLILLFIMIVMFFYFGYKYYPIYKNAKSNAKQTIVKINDSTFKRLEPTKIVRENGELVREFTSLKLKYIKFEDIPSYVKQAFISIEDKNFYEHDGVDYKAIIRATLKLIKNKGKITQGGSTITQQLVKLTFLTSEKSYIRKLNEFFLAKELENIIEKDKILEYYINNIYFGNGVYGFETASNYYFNKTSSELTLAEITFLAAIPNNPTIFNPLKHKENTIKRQNLILQNMLSDNIIDEFIYETSLNEIIELNLPKKKEYIPEDYEITFVLHSAIEAVMEYEGFTFVNNLSDRDRESYNKKYNEKYLEINDKIRQGGYTIVSTINPKKQQLLQEIINEELKMFTEVNEDNLYCTQGASVLINNKTHKIEAIIGGRTEDDQINTFNRAILSYRQPGSLMKPLVAYGIEMDVDLLGFHKYEDVKREDGPKNSGDIYIGDITIREALVRSVNTIPYELIRNRGPKLAHQYLHKMNFSKITERDLNAGISLGGLTYGASPLELAGAFKTLFNKGIYIKPSGIAEIKFKDDIIYVMSTKETKVYKASSAYILTDIMKDVLENPIGTGRKFKLNNMPAAAKTGTTNDNKDGWFAGYTPYYTSVIWVGDDIPKKNESLFGNTYPGLIWKKFMDEIHKDLEVIDFEIPSDIKVIYTISDKFYDYHKENSIKEVVPMNVLHKMNIINKNGVGSLDEKIEKERLRLLEIQKKMQEENFYNKYGVTLKSENDKVEFINKSIEEISNSESNTIDEILISISKLNSIKENQIKELHDEKNVNYLSKKINELFDILEIKKNELIALEMDESSNNISNVNSNKENDFEENNFEENDFEENDFEENNFEENNFEEIDNLENKEIEEEIKNDKSVEMEIFEEETQ